MSVRRFLNAIAVFSAAMFYAYGCGYMRVIPVWYQLLAIPLGAWFYLFADGSLCGKNATSL